MKFTWGTGIFLFILLFMAACVAFIIYSRTQVLSLVEADYYPRELRHEEKLVKMRNVNALSGPLMVSIVQPNLSISFPGDFKGHKLEGTILIYRPSDENLDLTVKIDPDTSLVQLIPLDRLSKGRYVLKAEWVFDGKGFYVERDLFIP